MDEPIFHDFFLAAPVRFAGNTLVVSQNGVFFQTSTWKIEDLHSGYYGVDTQPLMYLTPGFIAFCENEVAFLDSYVDGCDNYFVR